MTSENSAPLLAAAETARAKAYAPYSGFRVGAAVLMTGGEIFSGCNVENASFGLTNCAERVALQSAIAAGARGLVAVAIVSDSETPCLPCGACRQVLAEFGPRATVIARGLRGGLHQTSVDVLLPAAFTAADLAADQSSRG